MRVVVTLFVFALAIIAEATPAPAFEFETIVLTNKQPDITIELAYSRGTVAKHPVILMLGSVSSNNIPGWSTNLLNEGYMLAAFGANYPVEHNAARRAEWLYFDQRFAHSYVQGAQRAIKDTARVIDFLEKRNDTGKFGWVGSSSTGIPGLAVATHEKRLAAIVAFVSTGAYGQWFQSWHENNLWRSESKSLWPETEDLLPKVDPILHVKTIFPCAVLMINGGTDKVVDVDTARAFVSAARPHYRTDPDRLRLVVYEGLGHNLPTDIVEMYIEHWLHLYLNPTNPAPAPQSAAKNLQESAARTSVTGADHKKIMHAK